MIFFTNLKKRIRIGYVLSAIILTNIMLTMGAIKAEAADFKHTHGGSCYTQGTAACSAVHTQSSVPENTTAHCDNCGTSTAQTTTVRWENCQGNGEKYELGGYRNCTICGSQTYVWNRAAWNHQVSKKVLSCGKSTVAIGRLWIRNNTSGWTTEDVVLEAGVEIHSSELSLVSAPYSWDNKTSWVAENVKEITENGTYTVYAKSSGGMIVKETIDVTNIDRTGPGLASVDRSTTDWTNQDVVLTFNGEDVQPEGSMGCGLATQAYSFDGGRTYSAE
ncbi:MAG: hypothetical protein IJ443_07785, partial [Firmicutes bacterium]|nr:hypothetical protein [Bacillota bacterium]